MGRLAAFASLLALGIAAAPTPAQGPPSLQWLRGFAGQPADIAVSPDGRFLAVADATGAPRLWQIGNSSIVRTFPFLAASHRVAYAPDGGKIAAAGEGEVVVAATTNGGLAWRDAGTGGVSFSRDSARVLVENGGDCQVRRAADGLLLATWPGRGVFGPTGEVVHSTGLENDPVRVGGVAEAIDGEVLDASSAVILVKGWRNGARCFEAYDRTLKKVRWTRFEPTDRAWLSNDGSLALAAEQGTSTKLRIHSSNTGALIRLATVSTAGSIVTMTATRGAFYVGDPGSGVVQRYDLGAFGLPVTTDAPEGPCLSTAWNGVGDKVAAVFGDRRVRVYNAAGTLLVKKSDWGPGVWTPSSVAFDPTQDRVYVGFSDHLGVLAFHPVTGDSVSGFGTFGPVLAMSFTADGASLALATMEDGKPVADLRDPLSGASRIRVQVPKLGGVAGSWMNGDILAAGLDAYRLAANGASYRWLGSLPFAVPGPMAVAPMDLRAAFTGGSQVRLQPLETGAPVDFSLGGVVRSVAFTPDGRYLAVAHAQPAIEWRSLTGTRVKWADADVYGAAGLAFAPDGKLVSFGRSDGTLVVAKNPLWRNDAYLARVTLAAPSVVGGNPTVGTVSLPAPISRDALVFLSGTTGIEVPATVTIPRGRISATFPVATSGVDALTLGKVTATYNATREVPLTLVKAAVASIACASSVPGGTDFPVQVALNGQAGPAGMSVWVASSKPVVGSRTVVVEPGQTGAVASFHAVPVASTYTVILTTAPNAKSATLWVTIPWLDALVLPPSILDDLGIGEGEVRVLGTSTVSLSIALETDRPDLVKIPATVVIPKGTSSAKFAIKVYAVTAPTEVTVTARLKERTRTATFMINP